MRFLGNRRVTVCLLAGVLALGLGCSKTPSDSEVSQQIQAKLRQDSGLQDKTITVQTAAGVVTLAGNVDNDAQRAAAARYASAAPGVKEVVNNLQVGTAAAEAPLPATNQTAETTPPPPPPPPAKPKASVPKQSSAKKKHDPSEWDSSNSANQQPDNSAQGAVPAVADATPAQPAAVAPPPLPPPPPPKELTIQSGTTVPIRLIDSINSETAQQGQRFHATLDSSLSSNGEVAIPAGYKVEGHVVEVQSAGKFSGRSVLALQLDRISVGEKSYNLQTDQYRRQGGNRTTNTAEKVGAGAAIGAVLGGIFGGGKGAGIGAAAGGGLGGGVQAATKGQQIDLPSETVLTFTLQSPLTVTKVDKGPDTGRPKLNTPQ